MKLVFAIVMLSLVMVAWMFFAVPTSVEGTEIGFEPGTPDPNTFVTTYSLGYPLTWIEREHVEQASTNTDLWRWRFGGLYHVLCLVTHLVLAAVPIICLSVYSRQSNRDSTQ